MTKEELMEMEQNYITYLRMTGPEPEINWDYRVYNDLVRSLILYAPCLFATAKPRS